EGEPSKIRDLRAQGIEVLDGNAAAPGLLEAANVVAASALLVAIPDGFEGGQIVQKARRMRPDLKIIARAHSDQEVAHLKKFGATIVIMGEQEIAKAMIAQLG